MNNFVIKIAAAVLILIGGIVLTGWLADIPYLVPSNLDLHFMVSGVIFSLMLGVALFLVQRFRGRSEELEHGNIRLKHEIDERVGAEKELIRVNRALLVLSQCNSAIVQASEEGELLAEICRIIVGPGGYRLAWIAYAGSDPALPVKVMASSGQDAGYLDGVTITWDDSPTGRGPTGTAIRTGSPSVIRNILNDPAYSEWRETALRHGFKSSIALPLLHEQDLRGALNVYATEEDAFDPAETKLLTELAGDVSFGVKSLRAGLLRAKAEEKLRDREEFLEKVLDSIREGILVLDQDRRVIQGNPAVQEMFVAGGALNGKLCCDIFQKRYHSCPTGRALEERTSTFETVDAGNGKWLDIHVYPLHDAGVILCVRDVTDEKCAQNDLVKEKNKWEAIVGALGEGLTIQDRDLQVIYQNEIHSRRHGHHLGESCHEAYGCRPDYPCPLKDSFDTGQTVTRETRLPSGNSTLDLEITTSPLRDATGEIIAGIEIMRDISQSKQAERQIRKQLESINAMRNIDLAITATGDLRVTLNILLNHVRAHLFVDATTVLLVNPVNNTLEMAAAEGFFNPDQVSRTCVAIGSGLAGRVALERRPLHISPLNPAEVTYALQQEGFQAYYALPLIAKGVVTGVLELFHRSPFSPDSEWKSLAEAMAGQAVIAIDNARMFDALQRSNSGLIGAYDTTIAALSRALDFRDQETEGHSRRVTEMSVRIGRVMNITDEELYHVRRGALLHDIGKLGIPDKILLKPGQLDEEEKKVMERHPEIAYEILSPISFLRPALYIPYCHQEKWDGTGYPRRLRAEMIPLPARIFSVVDIWDALRSDRPYRKAWEEEKTRNYLRTIAGTHLDPDVVEIFMRMDWSSLSGSSRYLNDSLPPVSEAS